MDFKTLYMAFTKSLDTILREKDGLALLFTFICPSWCNFRSISLFRI